MKLASINPFMRYAELQPSVLSSAPLSCSYDYRIFYIIEGQANLVLTDQSVPLAAGTLLYFRPGTPYYFDGKLKAIVLNFDMTRRHEAETKPRTPSPDVEGFDPSMVFENDPPKELSQLIVLEHASEIESKMQECCLHYTYPTPYSDAATSALVKDILCYMVQNTHHEQKSFPELVQRVLLYIQQNYDKDPSNEQISAHFGYHSFYLNRLFKKHTSMTLHQAVLLEKTRIAKRLLRITDLSVSSIALEAGFADRSQFCTLFRKQTGYTPTAYRKKKGKRRR